MSPVFNSALTLSVALGAASLSLAMVFPACSKADSAPQGEHLPGLWGVNVHTPFNGSAMSAIGAQWVRLTLRWESIEKIAFGQYDWSAAEKILSSYLDESHLHVVVILSVDQLNPLYVLSTTDKPKVLHAISNWMGATAEHFKGRGIIWEIGNEPEAFSMGNYWNDPVTYAKMARLSAEAIKRADPEGKTAALALAWMDRTFASSALDAGLLGGGNVDYLSFHGYHRKSIAPESGLAEDVAWLRSKAASATPTGTRTPVVIDTETGYSLAPLESPKDINSWRLIVYSEEAQAAYLARHFIEEIYLGVPISIWYKDMYGENGFSLYYADAASPLGLRPMGKAFRTLASLLPQEPASLRNTNYDVSIKFKDQVVPVQRKDGESPEIYVRSFIRTDNDRRRTLVIAVWNSIEAFEGKILTARTFTATQCIERWRNVSMGDRINIPSQVTIGNVGKNSIGAMKVIALPDGTSSQTDAVIDSISPVSNNKLTFMVMVSPMPTIISISLNAE